MGSKLPPPAEGGLNFVEKLVEEAHLKYDIVYEIHLANHLVHGLYSLWKLGASLERIQSFYDHHTLRLEDLRKSKFKILETDWEKYINSERSYHEFLPFFDSEIEKLGASDSFQKWFPRLTGFSVGAAFHPLIHIGYGLEFQNPLVLAEGFAYACQSPQLQVDKITAKVESSATPNDDPYDIFDILEELRQTEIDFPADIGDFDDKTEFVLKHLEDKIVSMATRCIFSTPYTTQEVLNSLTESSILVVFATRSNQIDFFLLHGITANHAVRSILPHISGEAGKKKLLVAYLIGFLAAYVAQGKPRIVSRFITDYKATTVADSMSWNTIIEMGRNCDEEHVQKVIRSVLNFMEEVPENERILLCSDEDLRKCAVKVLDIVKDIRSFIF